MGLVVRVTHPTSSHPSHTFFPRPSPLSSFLSPFLSPPTPPSHVLHTSPRQLPNHNLRKRIEDWQQEKANVRQSLGRLQGQLFDATTPKDALALVQQIRAMVGQAHVDQSVLSKLSKLSFGVSEDVLDEPVRRALDALLVSAKDNMARAVALAKKQKEEAEARERVYAAKKNKFEADLAAAEKDDKAAAAALARAQKDKKVTEKRVQALREQLKRLAESRYTVSLEGETKDEIFQPSSAVRLVVVVVVCFSVPSRVHDLISFCFSGFSGSSVVVVV